MGWRLRCLKKPRNINDLDNFQCIIRKIREEDLVHADHDAFAGVAAKAAGKTF
jgi:hypothetical protein